MKINWKVRVQSAAFWIGAISAVATPIMAYLSLGFEDLTSWQSVWDVVVQFVKNPYLVFTAVLSVLSFLGVITDPTTKGMSDSERALNYTVPGGENK